MAEAIAKHHAGNRFEIYSAGSAPTRVNLNVLKVLREQGVDTTVLYSKGFDAVPQAVDYAISPDLRSGSSLVLCSLLK